MDIVNHILKMTRINEHLAEFTPKEYKKNYEYSLMEKEQKQINKRRTFKVVKMPSNNIVYLTTWTELNKYQQLNRIIHYTNKQKMDIEEKNTIIELYNNRKIKPNMVEYDDKNGSIIKLSY
jgi:hypothetical protein